MKTFGWTPTTDGAGVVGPGERLSWPKTLGIGVQHVVAMFGSTFLVPVLTGFPPATTLLFSGVGTLLFLLITGNRLPSYLGSSFAIISPITAATASQSMGSALGGIVAVGALLILVGGVVHLVGTEWIEKLMPPVVTGAIVALIGLNLAPAAKANYEKAAVTATVTLVCLILSLALFKGMLGRLAIFTSVLIGYVVASVRGEVDTSRIAAAPWIGFPEFHAPSFSWAVLPMFLPVVLVLVAENVGHVRSVAQMTGEDYDPVMGRAIAADGVATVLAGAGGGSATTTYAENIGVMAATRVYSTAAYWVAGVAAILLGLSPKVGAVIASIPPGVLGGITTALYGLVGILGVRIWVQARVDFSQPINQLTAAVPLIIGIADFTWSLGDVTFTGIALGSVAAIVIYQGMRLLGRSGSAALD
ncbi:pyrimidine permease RutG [Tsukamurella pulmonis]|uniref:Uracil-xanthine permease n=1 Tax=Tsukamurella pulmonis TaxID=47312 RepID=A0A1H1G188_9ACTN|nr:solute carrier family 23 protein [Tsukamurella pulmonis]KXO87780.1 nitrate reductase [Tsukamurella pulmonis]KXP13614.1 nitrate reductase [Tsukamurella pulmonis]RDH12070.1 nitrate reductase [Tsukamurella pulmonis]SDR06961.1 uracil-xanthine permease [Tsukamurella pulmonis]SUP18065.1 Putative pyrimidine permease RutG [Tsukamurella pulmonis]